MRKRVYNKVSIHSMSFPFASNADLKVGSGSIVKNFFNPVPLPTWIIGSGYDGTPGYLVPANPNINVYIPNNLVVGGVFSNPSDRKIKEDIQDIDQTKMEDILKLSPKQYLLKKDKTPHFGFIAQDVETILPQLVHETIYHTMTDNGQTESMQIKSVNYLEMIPLLVMKIQDLQNQIDELNRKCFLMGI